MATKRIELPDDNWAIITDDPFQMHMDRLVELRLKANKDDSVLSQMATAAVVAYTESWSLKDEDGDPVPLIEEQVRAKVRASRIGPLYEAIDAFIEETAPKVPNARKPRPKR